MLGVAYTLSKAMNYADNSDSGLTWNYEPLWERNCALADFDRTHNLQLYGIYELPFGPGGNGRTDGVAAAIAGGWQLNGVFSATSGTPFTVTSVATSVNAPGNTQTADQVKDTVEILGGIGRGNSYFDPARSRRSPMCDSAPPAATPSAAPASSTSMPVCSGISQSAAGPPMQFRAEVFNVTNRPAFNNPGANASTRPAPPMAPSST